MATGTPRLQFGPVKNLDLFANHWLDHRLRNEPEWTVRRDDAIVCLNRLGALWTDKKAILTPQLGEPTMEDKWVHPVLDALGWSFVYQANIHNRRPDYALFLSRDAERAALHEGKQSPEFWCHPLIVADAKAWDLPLDRRSQTAQREFPPEQIEWYMNHTGLDWGMLTNGRLWRLIPRELRRNQARFETYLEINLPALLEDWTNADRRQRREADLIDQFLPWYLLTTPPAFVDFEGAPPLIDRALTGSTEYRVAVGESLRDQVFEALRLCIEGFLTHAPNGLNPARDLPACRANSFTLLFRMLFILFAEDRTLLPYRTHPTYTKNRSLTRQHQELLPSIASNLLRPDTTGIWDYWTSLFDLIDRGHATYGVPAYNGGLFDRDAHAFLNTHALPDSYAALVLDKLRRAADPTDPAGEPVRVDYRDLAIQHLGNVYEGLLELHPRFAAEEMMVVRDADKIERTVPVAGEMQDDWDPTGDRYRRGSVYLETDKGERRATGSYYTPDHIVAYIVENTLSPLCQEIAQRIEDEIAETRAEIKHARGGNRAALEAKLARLSTEFDDRVLQLTVLDPAMGSGHFLLRACQHLAEQIATNPYSADPAEPETGDASVLLFWKRRVVERCIYGVDKNPIAVELAKLALWLETVSIDQPLSFLDHHLRHGDSLIGAKLNLMGRLHDPRVGPEALPSSAVEGFLPRLLAPLEQIRAIPSTSLPEVKEKERLYRQTFETTRLPFKQTADLWISTFFTPEGDTGITPTEYHRAVELLEKPVAHRRVAHEPWFSRASARATAPGIDAFHWELEFPEVFLAPDRTRAERAGFDAIIGNPPWGRANVLDVVRSLPVYAAVDEDHAECFIALAVSLLSRRGRVGLVLPDTVLSPAKAAIRRQVLGDVTTGAVYNIGANWFGLRVRMSTVLWLAQGERPEGRDYTFQTCTMPIILRQACQDAAMSLDHAIHRARRYATSQACLEDEEVAIPLFGTSAVVAALERAFRDGPLIGDATEHSRGVELNKAGDVVMCPQCERWDSPPRRDKSGRYAPKLCAHCGHEYRVSDLTTRRVLVADDPTRGGDWQPYIDGDRIRRYAPREYRWLDTSAIGINYKPRESYRSPKILIRQAGIGINAIFDHQHAYCPQSVYVYRMLDRFREEGFDDELCLSLLCSRLFHLQVFLAFGEIDSSRAFSKLTHARLARLRIVAPEKLANVEAAVRHLRACVRRLISGGAEANAKHDWDVEACWSLVTELQEEDVIAIVGAFASVHESDVLLNLFPGGIRDREDYWVMTWLSAMKRCSLL